MFGRLSDVSGLFLYRFHFEALQWATNGCCGRADSFKRGHLVVCDKSRVALVGDAIGLMVLWKGLLTDS
jgi:hypothetical protein